MIINKKSIVATCFACLAMYSPILLANQPTIDQQATSTAMSPHETDAQLVWAHIQSSKLLKQKLPGFMEEAKTSVDKHDGALPAALSLTIAENIKKASDIRNDLFNLALKHRSALYRIDQAQPDHEKITAIIIAMAAAITLYDNHQAMHGTFNGHFALQQKLNEAYPELGVEAGFYQSSINRATKYEYRKAMSDAIEFFNDNQTLIQQHISVSSPTIQTLTQYIAESQQLKTYHGNAVFSALLKLPEKIIYDISALPPKALRQLQFSSSKAVGNTLGIVRWRDGKLKDNATLLASLKAQLQPGDILLEKTAFTLTDKTIPGHFGHAAIYIGTDKQLQALDASAAQNLHQHWNRIQAGATVVEALRDGVQLNTLEDFMDIDDIAVLRPKQNTSLQQLYTVNIALGHLGKRYDFNFDVNTTETIVCSELIYIAYPEVDFITKRVLNSYTISPDDIALQAGEDASYPFSVVFFAHDGELIYDKYTNKAGQSIYASLIHPQKQPPLQNKTVEFFKGFLAKQ